MTDFRVAPTDLQQGPFLTFLSTSLSLSLSFSQYYAVFGRVPSCMRPSFRCNSICHADGSFDNILPLDLYASQNEKINSLSRPHPSPPFRDNSPRPSIFVTRFGAALARFFRASNRIVTSIL